MTLNRLKGKQRLDVYRAIENHIESNGRKFDCEREAADFFSTVCGFPVTKGNLKGISTDFELDLSPIYEQSRYRGKGTVAMAFEKINALQQRVDELEAAFRRMGGEL